MEHNFEFRFTKTWDRKDLSRQQLELLEFLYSNRKRYDDTVVYCRSGSKIDRDDWLFFEENDEHPQVTICCYAWHLELTEKYVIVFDMEGTYHNETELIEFHKELEWVANTILNEWGL